MLMEPEALACRALASDLLRDAFDASSASGASVAAAMLAPFGCMRSAALCTSIVVSQPITSMQVCATLLSCHVICDDALE
jgi:hypothetical protein